MKKKLLNFLSKLYVSLFITLIIVVLCYFDYINTEEKITLTSIGSGLIAITGLYFFHKRLKNQDKQIQNQDKQISLQINQRVDERFNSAITLLGSSETSARTGAVYALHELALEEEKYRQQIVQILCSHIRSKTNEVAYQETHEEHPSNEIQTTLNLLFKEHERGLYTQDFAKVAGFPRADLSHAYLVRASFKEAQCHEAEFWYAQCQGANFQSAQCQEASFRFTQCQGANFVYAQCQGVKFWYAQCQADFGVAQCQGANFLGAQCQGANFFNAGCEGVIFGDAQCQGANFLGAQCQGAYASKGHSLQTLSSRIGKKTEFDFLQLEGEIAGNVIKNIENSKNYLGDKYEKIQKIIQDNTGKKTEYGVPKYCTTGILENSEEFQAIIDKDWKKLEQLNEKQHD